MKVLVTDKSAKEALQVIKDAGHDITYNEMDGDTLLKEISKYDALMVRGRTKVIKEIVKAGASIIVTGNVLEENKGICKIRELVTSMNPQ